MVNKILFPIDVQEPEFALAAFNDAVKYAQLHNAPMHVLTVIPGFGMPLVASYFPSDALEKSKKAALATLQKFVAEHVPAGVSVACAIREGRPYEEIVEETDKVGADLIVIPSHNRQGLHGVLLGSVAENVVRHAHCSVLVVRQR